MCPKRANKCWWTSNTTCNSWIQIGLKKRLSRRNSSAALNGLITTYDCTGTAKTQRKSDKDRAVLLTFLPSRSNSLAASLPSRQYLKMLLLRNGGQEARVQHGKNDDGRFIGPRSLADCSRPVEAVEIQDRLFL